MATVKDVARAFDCLCLRSEGRSIEKTRLNKLLYFAQGHSLAERGQPLFPNQIDAWEHGPVVAVVYSGYDKIVENAERIGLADTKLSPDEMDLIMDIWDKYSGYTARELVDMTHQLDSPWAQTYSPDVRNAHIPQDMIERYFSLPENRLSHTDIDISSLPTETVLPAKEYDPDEDAVWEALLNDAK